MARTLVMISHSSEEHELAEAWKALICSVFRNIDGDAVFFSSELGAFHGREPFYIQLLNKIGEAPALISIQTPVSCKRPWVVFEGGMATALKGKALYPVIYEPRETKREESIFGPRLENPMTSLQQYRGALREDAAAILGLLQQDFQAIPDEPKPLLNPTKLDDALDEYEAAVLKHERCWIRKRTIFEKRIRLVFNPDEKNALQSSGMISDSVKTESVGDSMLLFDTNDNDCNNWRKFLAHLEGMKLPWPGSAARWGRGLGPVLQKGLSDSFIHEPEGLPLYFDARPSQHKCYRPSVTLREDYGRLTYFVISFTLLPPELRIRPDGRPGVLLHYLDFCRMMRWGALEERRFVNFFTAPGALSATDASTTIRTFIERILTIRTEFWNRGLKSDSLEGVIPQDELEKVRGLVKRYMETIEVIDPENKGVAPNPLPPVSILQGVYSDLLQLNKEYYEIVHRAFGLEIATLATSLEEI